MAGSWSTVQSVAGNLYDAWSAVRKFEAEFTAESDAGFDAVLAIGEATIAGFLQRVSVKFGSTPPAGAEFTVKITDQNGIAIGNPEGTALTESSNITVNQYFTGPLYVVITGNTAANATGVVSLYVS